MSLKLKFGSSFVRNRIILVIIFSLILLLPYIVRDNYSKSSLIGKESYHNYRIASLIKNNPTFPVYEPNSYGGRKLVYITIWPLFLSKLSTLLKIDLLLLFKVIPFLLGVLSFILFLIILQKSKLNSRLQGYIIALLMISTPFIYLFSTTTGYSLLIFLTLLGISLFLNNNYGISMLSIIPFSILPLIHPIASIVSILLLLFLIQNFKREKIKLFLINLFVFIIVYLIYYFPIYTEVGLPSLQSIELRSQDQIYSNLLIAEFGNPVGISIFSILLSFFGLFMLKILKNKKLSILFLIILLILLIKYFPWLIYYLNILTIILAAAGLYKLANIKWESEIIKNLTLLILFIGLISSSFLFIIKVAEIEPTIYDLKTIEVLKKQTHEGDVIFSDYKNGYLINAANRISVSDDDFIYAPNLNERIEDSKELFESKDIKNTTKILNKYNITYVIIDQDIKKIIFKDKETGLLYILKYGEEFKKIYANRDNELWEYKKEK